MLPKIIENNTCPSYSFKTFLTKVEISLKYFAFSWVYFFQLIKKQFFCRWRTHVVSCGFKYHHHYWVTELWWSLRDPSHTLHSVITYIFLYADFQQSTNEFSSIGVGCREDIFFLQKEDFFSGGTCTGSLPKNLGGCQKSHKNAEKMKLHLSLPIFQRTWHTCLGIH